MPYGSGHEELVLLGMEKKSMLRCDTTQGITRFPQAVGSKWPRSRRQTTTEAEATDGSNSSRYYHTRLSRNPSSRVNYNER